MLRSREASFRKTADTNIRIQVDESRERDTDVSSAISRLCRGIAAVFHVSPGKAGGLRDFPQQKLITAG